MWRNISTQTSAEISTQLPEGSCSRTGVTEIQIRCGPLLRIRSTTFNFTRMSSIEIS